MIEESLTYIPELSTGGEDCKNLLIRGNNKDVLPELVAKFSNGIKCIYIDPPYNNGDSYHYYNDNASQYSWLQDIRVVLRSLKSLLTKDGSIWISIDDREGSYLRVICDEIFGRQNFVSNISWQRTYSTRNDAKGIVNEVEHIRLYCKL